MEFNDFLPAALHLQNSNEMSLASKTVAVMINYKIYWKIIRVIFPSI